MHINLLCIIRTPPQMPLFSPRSKGYLAFGYKQTDNGAQDAGRLISGQDDRCLRSLAYTIHTLQLSTSLRLAMWCVDSATRPLSSETMPSVTLRQNPRDYGHKPEHLRLDMSLIWFRMTMAVTYRDGPKVEQPNSRVR